MTVLFHLAILIATGFPAFAAQVQSSEVALPCGRHLVIQGWRAASNRWVIYLPGSGCDIFPAAESLWIKTLDVQSASSVMVINKSGAALSGPCRLAEFYPASLRAARIADIRYVLKKYVPADAKIWLAGESEGAYLAPDIALRDHRVNKLFLFSAGTRSWIDEEISFAPAAQQATVRHFLATRVIGHPSLTHFYDGWTYAQLDSYDTHQTLSSLNNLRIPVFMLNGANDHETWVDATASDIQLLIGSSGKSNIEFHLIPRANHALGCEPGDTSCQPGAISGLELSFLKPFLSKD